jgi:hypothetical protein
VKEEVETEVRRRIGVLDTAPSDIKMDKLDIISDLTKVLRLMGVVTDAYIANTYADPFVGDADMLDQLVKDCQTLQRIATKLPALEALSLGNETQLWTVAAQTKLAPRRQSGPPAAETFKPAAMLASPQVKPTRVGLYTSTALPGSPLSMWLLYLQYYGGSAFPKPWSTYQLKAASNARIFEVGSAQDWVRLVQAFPARQGRAVYPDWRNIASEYDAVHLSLAAIVAIQGIKLTLGRCFAVEGYWDVETTFWLNWCFTDIREWKLHAES